MTINEYQKKCISALPKFMYRGEQTLHALRNLSGVSEENLTLYNKTASEGSELPKEALLDNLSETLFSVANGVVYTTVRQSIRDFLEVSSVRYVGRYKGER